ncbi:hypothetical protein NEFER03_0946 [Nematocida sp. LUAm3]|nr:hypothetical protein NEFER03_0946 [Nematocida sp. LUAm3]KAI5174964.1 hypothetical protein NEFER02_1064 [Nematocida sp. LUAm2]KAI5177437.1 hypothetical protein NEFER01_0687 [Nematocida sp. LUAm1]
MLLCREYIVSSIKELKPTYESLGVLSEYIVMFFGEKEAILPLIRKEGEEGNAYGNLLLLYLLNEILVKKGSEKDIISLGKSILEMGRQKALIQKNTSTQALKASAKELLNRFAEIERLWEKFSEDKKDSSVPSKTSSADIDEDLLDLDYLEDLCKKKDKKNIIKYLGNIRNK